MIVSLNSALKRDAVLVRTLSAGRMVEVVLAAVTPGEKDCM